MKADLATRGRTPKRPKTERVELRLSKADVRMLDALVKMRDDQRGRVRVPIGDGGDGAWSTRSDVLRDVLRAAYHGSRAAGEYKP